MKTLKQFYRELQAWIDDGCPEHKVFDQRMALCENLAAWASNGFDKLQKELSKSFADADLHRTFPFNKGCGLKFIDEDDCYQNPARLAWIKEHAA